MLALLASLLLAVGLFAPAAAAGPPVVTSVDPSSGSATGGDTVDVWGHDFTGLLGVKFGGSPAASFEFVDDGHLRAVTPPHAAGTVHVFVTTTSGTSGASQSADSFTFVGAPAVDDIDPASGPYVGGTDVTVTGSGFTGATAVTFGGTPATAFTVFNDFVLVAKSPPHALGAVHVVVWAGATPSPSTPADVFTYTGGAIVTGISPTYGPTGGGTVVSISGGGFTGVTAVTFGGTLATTVSFVSDSLLLAKSPPHAAGSVEVVVWIGATPSASSANDVFTYTAGPIVTGISPVGGPVSGGTVVTVSGAGFTGATAVTFGGSSASNVTVLSDTRLLATSPAHAAGAVHVVVWVGSVGSAITSADLFTYSGGPVVAGISPTSGPPTGGTVVTVTGSGFTGATAVTFGGTAGSGLSVTSDTRLVVTSPAHAAGTVDVVVWVGSVASATSSADLFTFTSATPSNPPARFAGSVSVGGAGVASGTTVEARVGSASCGSTTVFLEGGVSRYVVDVAAADGSHAGCGSEGAVVSFYVGGVRANELGIWHSYQLNVLDLTVGVVPPTPTPPVTPTPVAPGPPDTGAGLMGGPAIPGLTIIGLGLMAIAVGGALARVKRR